MSLDKDNERKNGEELENTQRTGNRRRRPKTRTGGSKRPIPPKPKRF